MAASKEIMAALHEALAAEFVDLLKNGVTCYDKDGNAYQRKANASELNVIRQMLKDNGIEAELTNSKPLQSVVAGLPFEGEAEIHQFPTSARH
jgi:hypothetical protein